MTRLSRNPRMIRRVMVAIVGCAWVALGFLSDNVPWFSDTFWIVACSAAGGAAFALARHRSVYALRQYTAIVVVVGTLRSAAYMHHGAWGPMCVWIILVVTTVVATMLLAAQREVMT